MLENLSQILKESQNVELSLDPLNQAQVEGIFFSGEKRKEDLDFSVKAQLQKEEVELVLSWRDKYLYRKLKEFTFQMPASSIEEYDSIEKWLDEANAAAILPSIKPHFTRGRCLQLDKMDLTRIPKSVFEADIEYWENLVLLNLKINRLKEIPEWFGELKKLQALDLRDNKISGNIPQVILRLKNLRTLDLSVNKITGNIPIEISNLENLKKLYLNNNGLTGKIPKELSALSKLQVLELQLNQLDSQIPEELMKKEDLVFQFSEIKRPCP